MKRVTLLAVLLFPILTLAVWCYWGFSQSRTTPANQTPMTTNAVKLEPSSATNQAATTSNQP